MDFAILSIISIVLLYHFNNNMNMLYTLWISRCIATARERIPGSIANYVTGVSECSQQRGNLKDNGYIDSELAIIGFCLNYWMENLKS